VKRALLILALSAGAALAQPSPGWEPYSASLQSRAAGGDASAQFAMGEAFRTGNGIGQDREQAINWYRKAAATDTRAADALGILLFTKGERKQAIPMLQGAASRRNDYALYILGTARFNGDYVPKDIPRAYADMRIAAATLPQAQRSLALMEPYITPIDKLQADRYAAQPSGPEAGAPAAPTYAMAPPPKPKPVVTRPPTPSVVTPALASPSVAPAIAGPVAPPSEDTSAPTPIRTVDLPPSQPLTVATTQPTVTTLRPPLTTAPPVPDNRPAPVPAPPVRSAPVTTPKPATTGGWRVQLGAYASEAVATAQWTMLVKKVPTLAPLQKVTQPAGALTRLQATGIASRDEATSLCAAVTAAKGVCLVLAPVS